MNKLFAIVYVGSNGETKQATTYAKNQTEAESKANARFSDVQSVGLVIPVEYETKEPIVRVITDIELLVLAQDLYSPIRFGRS